MTQPPRSRVVDNATNHNTTALCMRPPLEPVLRPTRRRVKESTFHPVLWQ